jgi:hypothetical protein
LIILAFLQTYSGLPAFHASACAPRVLCVSIRLMKSDDAILITNGHAWTQCSLQDPVTFGLTLLSALAQKGVPDEYYDDDKKDYYV